MKNKLKYKESSGNVFADLGLENPEELLAKAEAVRQISKIVKKKRLTQEDVSAILKIPQPKVSALLRGRLHSFSLERLFRFLNDLGRDVYIIFSPELHERGFTRIGESYSHTRVAALGK